MTGKQETRLRLGMLAAILLLAFGLRLYRLGAESLWYDETVSVHLASKGLPDLVAHTAGDIHPPGYYVLLRAWTRLAGSSDFAVAFPSLFFGVLLVALVYWLATKVLGARAGMLAAFVVAISPYNIWYSQEVRMYTLGAALGMGVLGAVLHLVAAPASRRTTLFRWLAVYAVCSALGLWALYYFAFLLVAVNLMVGLWWLAGWRRRRAGAGWLGRWLLAQAAVLLLYAPWISMAWRQATNPPVPPWRGLTALGDVLVETWSALSLGQSVVPGRVWPVLLLFGALFVLGLLYRPTPVWSAERGHLRGPAEAWPERWLLVGYVFLPMLLIYLASFITPLYHVRYAFTFSTPFYIIIGAGLAWLWQRWRVAGWLVLAVMVVLSGISFQAYHADPQYVSDDHRAAVRSLAEQWRPGDAILVNAGYAYAALVTYWDGEPIAWRGRLVGDGAGDWREAAGWGPVVVQAGSVDGAPSLGWGDLDSDFYSMSRAETAEALERLFADFDRVWVYRIYDTVTDTDGFIRDWLDGHSIQFQDRVFSGESGLRVQGFVTGRDPLVGAGVGAGDALADGSLRLVASSAVSPTVEVGGALDVALVWEVAAPPADDAILFAGLFDETGRRWAQTDEHPLAPLYPASEWRVGTMVRTPVRIPVPVGTPLGLYRVEVGWYRFVDGQPVWLPWMSGARLLLGEVEVVAPEAWQALAHPEVAYSVDVTIGEGVRLIGFDAPVLEARPGETLGLDILWMATEDGPEAAPPVFRLEDDAGQVFAEVASAPVGGRAPFTRMMAGQAVRDPVMFELPGRLAPGVYNLVVGRRRAGGSWLPVRRGPFLLGSTYPLATIRVLEQQVPGQ
jgi:4-amino-4-deoxy-L-arabinose transferase-like glycosyltransferase